MNFTNIIQTFGTFLRKNAVLCIAILAAAVSAFFVKPDAQYLSYFDTKTLTCLFCTLAVICALKNIRFFTTIAKKTVESTGNLRSCVTAIVYITFIGSMIIANDMALLTFLPLGYIVLKITNMEKYTAYVFIMQNIAANLGGMLTPFGNPQNLYLYEKFKIPTAEFMRIMLLPFLISVFLITVLCLVLPKKVLSVSTEKEKPLPPAKTALYILLFVISILTVFRLVPYYICLAIIIVSLLFLDKDALKKVDYPLLLTFCAFFIFAGNMARIEGVRHIFSLLLQKNTFLVSTLSCQIISNVPSAILLSNFTENYPSLLVGVNVGGVGTLISSLASLITFRVYTENYPEKSGKYLFLFTAMNLFFLVFLIVSCLLLGF